MPPPNSPRFPAPNPLDGGLPIDPNAPPLTPQQNLSPHDPARDVRMLSPKEEQVQRMIVELMLMAAPEVAGVGGLSRAALSHAETPAALASHAGMPQPSLLRRFGGATQQAAETAPMPATQRPFATQAGPYSANDAGMQQISTPGRAGAQLQREIKGPMDLRLPDAAPRVTSAPPAANDMTSLRPPPGLLSTEQAAERYGMNQLSKRMTARSAEHAMEGSRGIAMGGDNATWEQALNTLLAGPKVPVPK